MDSEGKESLNIFIWKKIQDKPLKRRIVPQILRKEINSEKETQKVCNCIPKVMVDQFKLRRAIDVAPIQRIPIDIRKISFLKYQASRIRDENIDYNYELHSNDDPEIKCRLELEDFKKELLF